MSKINKLSKIDLFSEFLKDPDRKSLLKIFAEVFSLTIYHRSFPRHYFSRYLFKNHKHNIKDYMPNKFLASLKPFFIDETVIEVVENKLFFNFFYSQFNINTPKILMYNHEQIFVIDKESFKVDNIHTFKKLLKKIFKLYPHLNSIIIKKTYGSYGGDRVYKFYNNQLNSNSNDIMGLYTKVIKSGFLFQETVKQHPALNNLNPSCLNTIRFDTFIDSSGDINIISASIRMSINNSHVDNVSSGGCGVGVNLENGKLKKEGYGSFSTNGVKILTVHPVTNVTFENFKIPFFNQAKELVIKTTKLMPGLRLMGWDIAIGESGPVLIEGNSKYNAAGNDLAVGGYRTNAIFGKILKEIDYL